MSKRLCFKKTLIYSYCFGIAAHGMMIFNKYSWHDDLAFGGKLSFRGALELGRWFRAILAYIAAYFTNGANLSLPLFHGLLSIFFIALSAFILIRIFDIENALLQSILCGLLVTYPVVTSTFGYMFTAPYYFFALFLAVFAVYFELSRNNAVSFAVSSLCICLSTGTYQAYFSVAVTCFVLVIIVGIIDDRFDSVKTIFLRGFRYIFICAYAMAEYYIIWKVFLNLSNISASNYQGINNIGSSGINGYLEGIWEAYRIFFLRSEGSSCNLFPLKGAFLLEWAVICICAGISLALILRKIRKNVFEGLLLVCLIGILPLCFNLICVISAASPGSFLHTLMLYADAMLYVYCIWLLQYILKNKAPITHKFYRMSAVLLSLLLIMNVYFANACYLKAEILQEQTMSEMTVLVTRIKSVEQYKDEMPVAFVLTGELDSTRTDNEFFEDFKIVPFGLRLSNPYSMRRNMLNYLSIWCGFSPEYVDSKHFEKMEEVEAMPCYPDDGSIRIIEGTVVVKI